MASDDDEDFVLVTSAPTEVCPMVINGLVTADFTGYDTISKFPDFMSVNNLQVIRMSTNELKSLPDAFCKMKCLKELYLFGDRIRQGNGLSALPENFGNLQTLEVLNLERNQLENFPMQICDITNLRKLYLNSCGVTRIPPEISKLINLTDLDLSYNDLSKGFPDEFFELPRLRQLYLIGCCLEELPPEIEQLGLLEGLRLNENFLETFPEELYTLRHLKKLYAVKNNISTLSSSICGLQSLEMLLLMENNITELPPEISKLQCLQYVNVFDNKLTCLPSSITQLSSSTQVVFSGNTYLQMPPLSVCNKGMDSIKGFFESMTKSRAVHSDRLKMVLLGESGAGKTSLAHALVHCKSIQMMPNDSTVGVVINHWQIEPDGLEAQIVDCAGQRRYQLTHPFFLSEEALHILVVNLKTYQKTDASFAENTGDWIKWVTARLLKPRIMVVLTHRDECSEEEVQEKCADILDRMQRLEEGEVKMIEMEINKVATNARSERDLSKLLEKLQWQKTNRPVISSLLRYPAVEDGKQNCSSAIGMLPVSSMRELEGMIELRNEIITVAKDKALFPSVGRDLPESWIRLEEGIKDFRQNIKPPVVPCMTLREFEEFAKEKSGLSGIGLRSALNYLDSVGELKFYSNIPGIEYSVFLDLCWLGKLVKLLFRHDYNNSLKFNETFYQYDMEKILFDQCVSQLKESGVLSLKLLRCIWQDLSLNEDTFQQMVKALQHFGLACELPPSEEQQSLFIPWFLHTGARPNEWTDIPEDDLVEIRLVFAMCGYLPGGLFDRLRIRCYSLGLDADNWRDGTLIHMGGDLMILIQTVDPNHDPTILVSGRAPKECRRELWAALIPVIKETEALLNEWSRLSYHTYTVCPLCVCSRTSHPGYFSCQWLKGRKPASLRCKKSTIRKRHVVDADLLVPPPDVLQSDGTCKPLDEEVPEALLSDLSAHIPKHWKPLAYRLGFSQNQVDTIDSNYPDVTEKANSMLQRWRTREGRNAKRSVLISSLKEVQKGDVIEMVQLYRSNTV